LEGCTAAANGALGPSHACAIRQATTPVFEDPALVRRICSEIARSLVVCNTLLREQVRSAATAAAADTIQRIRRHRQRSRLSARAAPYSCDRAQGPSLERV
jgi:hypothetical protein